MTASPMLIKLASRAQRAVDCNRAVPRKFAAFLCVMAIWLLFALWMGYGGIAVNLPAVIQAVAVVCYIISVVVTHLDQNRYLAYVEMIVTDSLDEYQAFVANEVQFDFKSISIEQLPLKWQRIIGQRAKERLARSLIERAEAFGEGNAKGTTTSMKEHQ